MRNARVCRNWNWLYHEQNKSIACEIVRHKKTPLTWSLNHLFIHMSLCGSGRRTCWRRRRVLQLDDTVGRSPWNARCLSKAAEDKGWVDDCPIDKGWVDDCPIDKAWRWALSRLSANSKACTKVISAFLRSLCSMDADDKPLLNASRVYSSRYVAAVSSENVHSFARVSRTCKYLHIASRCNWCLLTRRCLA